MSIWGQVLLFRFPFSLFLMPVFLLGILAGNDVVNLSLLCIPFLIWHVLVYPSSNAYNSVQDRDEGPIGGLEKPQLPHTNLLYVTWIFDIIAITASLVWVNGVFAGFVFVYILISRAYSYRGVRLKKYPIIGFLSVVLFQGFWVCMSVFYVHHSAKIPTLEALLYGGIATLLISGVYPLTQIYQHEADRKDGVYTLSMVLGFQGTFLFSGFCFAVAFAGLFIALPFTNWIILLTMQTPVLIYFAYWQYSVWKMKEKADFKNTLRMLVLASACMNIGLISLLVKNAS